MNMSHKAIIFPVILGAQALAVSVQAAPLTISKTASVEQQAAAEEFWTKERIKAAPAMKIPVDFGSSGIDANAVDSAAWEGPAGNAPPGLADPGAARIARAAYAEDWRNLESPPALGALADGLAGTPGVYTSYDVNTQAALWKIYPHVWDGKLTFSTPSGSSSCSATVISNNHIVTAAHCIYDSTANQFYSSWVFTPAYRNGSAPYGTFSYSSCRVLTSWVNLAGGYSINTWARHDVAVCSLNRNSAGQTINSAVGWAGRLWNASYQQLVFNSGYPARTYTDAIIANGPAQYLRACTAETFQQTTETLGSGCSWGRGISGGSWLISYKPFVNSGLVNSVNSGLFIGAQNIYGARFNSSNIVSLCTASGC